MTSADFMERSGVDLNLGGRYSLANKRDLQGNRREYACRTSRVSPFQMMMSVPVVGSVGERVISYFGEFGKLDGWITSTVQGGFLYELAITKARQQALASKLTWLQKQKHNPALPDARSQERIIPENPHSRLIFGDGSTLGCFVVDMSATGAAISADVQPAIGTPLAVGRTVGRVVRHFREGFAIRFVEAQDRELLEQMIIRP